MQVKQQELGKKECKKDSKDVGKKIRIQKKKPANNCARKLQHVDH